MAHQQIPGIMTWRNRLPSRPGSGSPIHCQELAVAHYLCLRQLLGAKRLNLCPQRVSSLAEETRPRDKKMRRC